MKPETDRKILSSLMNAMGYREAEASCALDNDPECCTICIPLCETCGGSGMKDAFVCDSCSGSGTEKQDTEEQLSPIYKGASEAIEALHSNSKL